MNEEVALARLRQERDVARSAALDWARDAGKVWALQASFVDLEEVARLRGAPNASFGIIAPLLNGGEQPTLAIELESLAELHFNCKAPSDEQVKQFVMGAALVFDAI